MNKHYSPQLDRELVRILYYRAKALGIPMTTLANQLIRDALALHDVLEWTCGARTRHAPISVPRRVRNPADTGRVATPGETVGKNGR